MPNYPRSALKSCSGTGSFNELRNVETDCQDIDLIYQRQGFLVACLLQRATADAEKQRENYVDITENQMRMRCLEHSTPRSNSKTS